MPNWCYNTMYVYGPKAECERFKALLVKAEAMAKTQGHNPVYQTFLEAGFTPDEIDATDCRRGWYTDEFELKQERGHDVLDVRFETAWGPCHEAFTELLRRFFPLLEQVTLAEESGCEVYVNTDTDGLFFEDRYYIWGEIRKGERYSCISDDGSQYQSSYENALSAINKWLEENGIAPLSSVHEAEELVNSMPDCNLNVYEFAPC